LAVREIEKIVGLAHGRGVPVYVDDAGGARVGPAVFDQPRTLQLGVDLVATGLDKYGTVGPRLGVMAGEKSLVERIRVRGYEMGLEARPFLYPAALRRRRRLRARDRRLPDEACGDAGRTDAARPPAAGRMIRRARPLEPCR